MKREILVLLSIIFSFTNICYSLADAQETSLRAPLKFTELSGEENRVIVLKAVIEKVKELENKYGIKAAFVYGSLALSEEKIKARGPNIFANYTFREGDDGIHRFGKGSDIDIVIVGEAEKMPDEAQKALGDTITVGGTSHILSIFYRRQKDFLSDVKQVLRDALISTCIADNKIEMAFNNSGVDIERLFYEVKKLMDEGEYIPLYLAEVFENIRSNLTVAESVYAGADKEEGYYDYSRWILFSVISSLHGAIGILEFKRPSPRIPVYFLKRQLENLELGWAYKEHALGILGIASYTREDIEKLAYRLKDNTFNMYGMLRSIKDPAVEKRKLSDACKGMLLAEGAYEKWVDDINFLIKNEYFEEAVASLLDLSVSCHVVLRLPGNRNEEIDKELEKYDGIFRELGFLGNGDEFLTKKEHGRKLLELIEQKILDRMDDPLESHRKILVEKAIKRGYGLMGLTMRFAVLRAQDKARCIDKIIDRYQATDKELSEMDLMELMEAIELDEKGLQELRYKAEQGTKSLTSLIISLAKERQKELEKALEISERIVLEHTQEAKLMDLCSIRVVAATGKAILGKDSYHDLGIGGVFSTDSGVDMLLIHSGEYWKELSEKEQEERDALLVLMKAYLGVINVAGSFHAINVQHQRRDTFVNRNSDI